MKYLNVLCIHGREKISSVYLETKMVGVSIDAIMSLITKETHIISLAYRPPIKLENVQHVVFPTKTKIF